MAELASGAGLAACPGALRGETVLPDVLRDYLVAVVGDLNAVAAKEVAQGIGRSHGVSAEGEVKAAGGSPAMAEIRKYLTGKLQWRQLTHFREIGNEGKLKPRFGKKPTFFRSVRKYRRAFPEKSRRRFAEAENSAA